MSINTEGYHIGRSQNFKIHFWRFPPRVRDAEIDRESGQVKGAGRRVPWAEWQRQRNAVAQWRKAVQRQRNYDYVASGMSSPL